MMILNTITKQKRLTKKQYDIKTRTINLVALYILLKATLPFIEQKAKMLLCFI